MTWFFGLRPYESAKRETSIHALVGRQLEKSQLFFFNACITVTVTAAADGLHYLLFSQYRQWRMMRGLFSAGQGDYLRGNLWLSAPCVCLQRGLTHVLHYSHYSVNLGCVHIETHSPGFQTDHHCSIKAELRLQFLYEVVLLSGC